MEMKAVKQYNPPSTVYHNCRFVKNIFCIYKNIKCLYILKCSHKIMNISIMQYSEYRTCITIAHVYYIYYLLNTREND